MNPRTLLAALLALHIAAALVPFRFDPPRYVVNRLERTAGGGWRFEAPSLALTTTAPPWIREAIRSETLTIDLRVRPGRAGQSGPARILTNSADFTQRNVMVAQQDGDLVVRIRRPGSDPNGEPAFVVPDVLQAARWRDVTVAIRPGRLRITVDGDRRVDQPLPPDALDSWDLGFGVALGNEIIGKRPWTGEIAVAVVTTPSARDDLLAPGRLAIPDGWWHVPDRLRSVARVDLPLDAGVGLLHLVAFVPVGYLLVRIRRPRMGRLGLVASLGGLSLAIELVKVVIAGRHPSLVNLLAQIVGGVAGATMSAMWLRRR